MKKTHQRRENIGHQILWLVARTTMLAVLAVSLMNIVGYFYTSRSNKVEQIRAIAQVLAENSTAAVSFEQSDAAQQLLESLARQPEIVNAVIVDTEGKIFAQFSRSPESAWTKAPSVSDQATFKGNMLDVQVPIMEFDQPIGRLIIRADASDIFTSVVRFIVASILLCIAVLAVGIWLTARLQRSISGPIMNLASMAQEVSSRRDYSLRIQNTFGGEIGILCRHFNEMLEQIETAHKSLRAAHKKLVDANEELESRVAARTQELALANEQLQEEVRNRMKAFEELKDLQHQIAESSRQAGMAEIANGVLHNVGNVLNSVNVSSSVIAEKIRGLKIENLDRIAQILEQNSDDLPGFFQNDPRAAHLPKLLAQMAKHFREGQSRTLEETKSLTKNIGFIKDIIQSQQSYAGGHGVVTTMRSDEIFEDALKFVGTGIERDKITVHRRYEAVVSFSADKSKLLQILTNFVKNAREAVREQPEGLRRIELGTRQTTEGMLEFSVTDTGHGIQPENLKRIYTHGFTTKKDGHGFGLHSAAIAAREMGGSTSVHSEGPGLGATFSVTIPLRRRRGSAGPIEFSAESANDSTDETNQMVPRIAARPSD